MPCIQSQVTSQLVFRFILTESIICQSAITSYSKKNVKNHDLPEQGAYI